MAALDFPNAPVNGTQYSAPNGALYTYDGTAWTVSGVLSTGSAAGGDLSGTYPNPAIAAGAVTAAKLAAGATLPSPPALQSNSFNQIGTAEVILLDWSPTISASRPVLILASALGFQQYQLTTGLPINNNLTFNFRRDGTTGTVSGTVLTAQTVSFTFTAQWLNIPFTVFFSDVYAPAATGAVRYSLTAVGTAAAGTTGQPYNNSTSIWMRALPFS